MKKVILSAIAVFLLGGIGFWLFKGNPNKNIGQSRPEKAQPTNQIPMKITSSVFEDQGTIPPKYTCDGDGVNPPLSFFEVPKAAKTLALIVDDPDAPSGTWVHWLLWNIAPEINQVAENSAPQGATQGQGSSGQNVYGGPCPPASPDPLRPQSEASASRGGPSGTHHYIFKLYALDAKLSIPSYSTSADLEKAMQGHIIGQAQLVGLYSRGK